MLVQRPGWESAFANAVSLKAGIVQEKTRRFQIAASAVRIRLDQRSSSPMKAHPAHTFRLEARKRERVLCSSLFYWPVHPRWRRIVRAGLVDDRVAHGPRMAQDRPFRPRRCVAPEGLKAAHRLPLRRGRYAGAADRKRSARSHPRSRPSWWMKRTEPAPADCAGAVTRSRRACKPL